MPSNVFLPIHNPVLASNVNWIVKVFSVRDNFTTALTIIEQYISLSGTVSLNDPGAGSITLDLDSPVFNGNLTNGEPGSYLLTAGLLFRAYEAGIPRFEFFSERQNIVEASDTNGVRSVTISGRGSAAALSRARVLTPGFPSTTNSFWKFKNESRMTSWLRLLSAAKSRGTVPYVNPMFTLTADSAGNAWADTPTAGSSYPEYVPDLNQDLLEVLDIVTGQNIDEVAALRAEWVMFPLFRLDVRPTIGVHREDQVIFNDGGSVSSRELEVSIEDVANYVGVRDVYGKVSLATSSSSITEFGQIETLQEYAHLTNPNNAMAVANTLLELSKNEYKSWTLSVKPDYVGRTVFRDYGIGDWVGVDKFNQSTGTSSREPFRVMSISISVDQGQYSCELTLNSRIDLNLKRLKERLGRLLNRPNPGTLPSLPSPPVIPPYDGIDPVSPVYGITPVDGRWGLQDMTGAATKPPCIYQANEPTIEECPVGYFWLKRTD